MSPTSKVLVIGDSISIGYTPHAAEALQGRFAVVHHEGNSGDSAALLADLDSYLAAAGDADVIHFNVGLHDLKRPRDGSGAYQVPLDQFAANLARIVEKLQATGKLLIWATLTPVIFERHLSKGFDRRQDDVGAYNRAAAEIITSAGIAIDDLHAAVVEAGVERCICADGVHMTDDGYAILGRTVAAAVEKHWRGDS